MQLSNLHKSFSKHLLSTVDKNLEVIRGLNHVCDSEIKDLEPSKTYSFQFWIRELTSRTVHLMKMGLGGFFQMKYSLSFIIFNEMRSSISFQMLLSENLHWSIIIYFFFVKMNSLPYWEDIVALVLTGHYRLYIVHFMLRYFMIVYFDLSINEL